MLDTTLMVEKVTAWLWGHGPNIVVTVVVGTNPLKSGTVIGRTPQAEAKALGAVPDHRGVIEQSIGTAPDDARITPTEPAGIVWEKAAILPRDAAVDRAAKARDPIP